MYSKFIEHSTQTGIAELDQCKNLTGSEGSQKGSRSPRAASAGAGSRYPPPVVHLHDFQHIKRAGEAGSRLRALGVEGPFEAPLMLAGAREGFRECDGRRVGRGWPVARLVRSGRMGAQPKQSPLGRGL